MIARRLTRISMLALAAVAATGCATFSDNDVVARVGDAELSSADLDELLGPALDPLDPTVTVAAVRADGDATRAAVAEWVRHEVARESGLAAEYDADPVALGITCLDVIVAASEGEAVTIQGQLADGGDWDELSEPSEATFGYESRLQCQPYETWAPQVSPDFAEFITGLDPGGAADIADLQTGQFAVVRAQPFDAVDTLGLLTLIQTIRPDLIEGVLDAADAVDVYVDPRVGGFDATTLSIAAVD